MWDEKGSLAQALRNTCQITEKALGKPCPSRAYPNISPLPAFLISLISSAYACGSLRTLCCRQTDTVARLRPSYNPIAQGTRPKNLG